MASVVAKHFGTAQRLWAERVEKRITVTANMLGSIKVVKMLSLTDAMSRIISDLRRIELQGSEKFRKLLVSQILIGKSGLAFASQGLRSRTAALAAIAGD